jgi:hypothetical protein
LRESEREGDSGMWYFEEQDGTKTNMKLVIWCFESGEGQSAVMTREEIQTIAELIMVHVTM